MKVAKLRRKRNLEAIAKPKRAGSQQATRMKSKRGRNEVKMKPSLQPARSAFIAVILALPLTLSPLNAFAQNRNPAANMGGKPAHRPGAWLRKYQALPPQDQMRALENDSGYKKLSPDRQMILRNRLQQFNALPPEQKERTLNRLRAFETLNPAQKQTVRELHGDLRQLPEDRRQSVRKAFRELKSMPEDQREQTMKSPQFRSSFSGSEINLLHGMLGLGQFFQPNQGNKAQPPAQPAQSAPPPPK